SIPPPAISAGTRPTRPPARCSAARARPGGRGGGRNCLPDRRPDCRWILRPLRGLLEPDVRGGWAARSHAGVGVAEDSQIRFAVAVEIADEDPVFVVDAILQGNPLDAILAQTILAAEENEDLIRLPVCHDEVVDAIAVPVGYHGSVADQRERLLFLSGSQQ